MAVWCDSEPEGELGWPAGQLPPGEYGFDVIPEQGGPRAAGLVVRLVWVGFELRAQRVNEHHRCPRAGAQGADVAAVDGGPVDV